MEDLEVSMVEMLEYIHKKCGESISKDTIELILDLQVEFLDSKGLIQVEEDDLY